MKPKINFREKDGKLLIAIYINRQGRGLYDTGIKIDQWDEEKEETEDPEVNAWMATTKVTLLKQFRPDMTPKRLWQSFINNQSETTATINDAFEYYMANMPMKPSTIVVYKSIIKSLVNGGIYNTPLSDITPALLRSFLNGLVKKDSTKLMDSSKFNSFWKIKGAVNRYIRDHRLTIDIDWEGIVKKPKFVRKEDEWLSMEEVQKLLDLPLKWVRKDARDLFCLCCFTGMSMSDALAFSPQKNVKEINGRDFIVFNRVKTDSLCKVPVIKQAKEIIESRPWPIVIAKRTFQYQVGKLGEVIGRKLKTHMARKTMGSLFLEFGFSIETVSKLLGHANTTLTQRTYAVVTQAKIERELTEIGI